jgi:hypothetical protein
MCTFHFEPKRTSGRNRTIVANQARQQWAWFVQTDRCVDEGFHFNEGGGFLWPTTVFFD